MRKLASSAVVSARSRPRGNRRGSRTRRPERRFGQARWASSLCVPKTPSTSCDQVIFVDQATDARLSSDAVLVEIDRLG